VVLLHSRPSTGRSRLLLERAAPPSPDLASQLRHAVADRLAAEHLDEWDLNSVQLVLSELVANASRAARTSVVVRVSKRGSKVLVEVEDDGPGWPSVRDAAPEDAAGRGLTIVDDLSEEVGVVPLDQDGERVGKRVWACVPLPSTAGPC
jgi:anti-sigma regulatory factor (Ser/Thr protein kinase)